MMKRLNCTHDALRKKAKRLGLKRISPKRSWTQKEEAYLRTSYPTRPLEEIAEQLDRTVVAIKIRATRLGIRRADDRED
jgi:hypothetical protein